MLCRTLNSPDLEHDSCRWEEAIVSRRYDASVRIKDLTAFFFGKV